MDELFNPDGLVLSENYISTMENAVLPYLKARETDEFVEGAGGAKLFMSRFQTDETPRGTVFVLHGFTENAYKFSEIIYSLLKNGFCVAAYDQRGHGRSERDPKISDISLTHVDRFSDYEKDLARFCEHMRGKMPEPWSIFCHSMGGAVTALYLARHKDVFSRAAMCAPMIAINRRGIPFFIAKPAARALKLFGKGRRRMSGSKPYSGPENFESSCATGRQRFEWYDRAKQRTREFQNNGASYSWVLAALGVPQKLLFPGVARRISCPVAVYAAEDDWEVLPRAQQKFVRGLKRGTLKTVAGARHEIYRSDDKVLFPWWHEVLGFLMGEG